MKVICIDAGVGMTSKLKPPFKEGDILTANQCSIYIDCYDIIEHPKSIDGVPASYIKDRFIPLSTIDETELLKERQNQLV